MFGTVARMRPKPGQEGALLAWFETWQRERRPKVEGAIASYIYRSERRPGDLLVAIVFADRASYERNASDPEQDRYYQQMRALLEDDPVWEDGEIIAHMS